MSPGLEAHENLEVAKCDLKMASMRIRVGRAVEAHAQEEAKSVPENGDFLTISSGEGYLM
jgi:hypothetical protein